MKNLRSRILTSRATVEDLCDTPPIAEQVHAARQIAKKIKLVPTLSSWTKDENDEFFISSTDIISIAPPAYDPFENKEIYALKHLKTESDAKEIKEVISNKTNSDMLHTWINHSLSDERMTLIAIRPDDKKKPVGFLTYRRGVSVDMYNDDEPVNVLCHTISIDYVYVEPHHRNGIVTTSLIRAVLEDVYDDVERIASLGRNPEFKELESPINFRVYADVASVSGEKFVTRMMHAIDDVVQEKFSPQEISEFYNKSEDCSIEIGF